MIMEGALTTGWDLTRILAPSIENANSLPFDAILLLAAVIAVAVGLYMTATGSARLPLRPLARDHPADARTILGIRWFGCAFVLFGLGGALLTGLDYRLLGIVGMGLSGLGGFVAVVVAVAKYGSAPDLTKSRIVTLALGVIVVVVVSIGTAYCRR